jgi:hypothetical protein
MKVGDVEQPRFNLRPLLHLAEQPPRGENAIPLLAIRSEQ